MARTQQEPSPERVLEVPQADLDDLRASFGLYRSWHAHLTQNEARQQTKLTIPVLGIGGANSWGDLPAHGITPAASEVTTAVIPNAGHWVAEQNPAGLLDALVRFMAPYAQTPESTSANAPRMAIALRYRRVGDASPGKDLVCGGIRSGQPLRVSTFESAFTAAAIGTPGLQPHELRHTASLAIASSADVKGRPKGAQA